MPGGWPSPGSCRGSGSGPGSSTGPSSGGRSSSRPSAPTWARFPGRPELGYRLLRRYWRQGLASEGARELIRHGFQDLGLQRVFAETMAVNVASRATLAAVGMSQVRTFHLDRADPIPGAEHGDAEYEITSDTWRTIAGESRRTGV